MSKQRQIEIAYRRL